MLLGLADIMFSVKVNAFAKRIQRAAQEKANYESGKNIVVEPIEPDGNAVEPEDVGANVVKPEPNVVEAEEDAVVLEDDTNR